MSDITVPVPAERVAEFYQFFGLWLAGSLRLPGVVSDPGLDSTADTSEFKYKEWSDIESDLDDAVTLWKKYSPRARAMFSLLIDNPGKEFTGSEIAEAVNIPNGAHGVAGVLAWPGRHGYALSRRVPSEFREDPETFETSYKMSPPRAELFRAARARAEATSA